jgi:hypothetical protein
VSGRIIEAEPFGRMFFNQQVATFALDDGGDGDAWLPTFIHLAIIFRVNPSQNK